jgi:hypothetical protein
VVLLGSVDIVVILIVCIICEWDDLRVSSTVVARTKPCIIGFM